MFDDDDFDDGKGSRKGNVLLRNVVKVEDIGDPVAIGALSHMEGICTFLFCER